MRGAGFVEFIGLNWVMENRIRMAKRKGGEENGEYIEDVEGEVGGRE